MSKITELREKQLKLVADARALRDEINDSTTEARVAEIDAAHDKAMAEYDRVGATIAREEALEAREAELNSIEGDRRPLGETRQAKVVKADERPLDERRAEAFNGYLRHGLEGLSPEQRQIVRELRAGPQATAPGADGGYLVPQGFMAELVKSLKAWGPMLDPGVTRVLNTATGNTIPWPTMDDTSNTGALIAENTQVALAEMAFGTKTLEAYKYTSGVVLVSSELLQDAVLDVEAIVRDAMAERIGRIANTHLTTGDGSSKPHGIIAAAGAGFTAGSATAISFDDLIETYHSVDPAYRSDPSCRFMFNDSTLKALRKLKNGEGEYIWQPANVTTGQPDTILNMPYSVNQAVASIATGAKTIAFGAFNRYVVRKVNEFSIKRLVERYADFDQTGFIGFTRFDGELLDQNAVKVLSHP
ncbi:phage major capsid protein [Rhizobium leucaenae]|uniref:phage major capsid protein n=1 Tax=Rhizobium leucaenae TaxID=29450 RepID=UPI00040BC483|nr:phage major capsid protein [Rhizobium leucaenae]MBB6299914.1 HK97 family phage major capsid protein [Rhizobium leucaenae]